MDVPKKIVLLPKPCSWYLGDFTSRKATTATALDCLRVLVHYVNADTKALLVRLLNDTVPSIKFKNYIYRCRVFSELKSGDDDFEGIDDIND